MDDLWEGKKRRLLEAWNGKRDAIGPIWLTEYLFDVALDPRPCREA